MSAVQPFVFNGASLRVATGPDGEPWFVAADVCAALDIGNSRDALSRLDDDEKGVGTADTLGGAQTVGIVSEAGVYGLIWTSRKPEASAFRRWLKHEVVPALRKSGTYSVQQIGRRELAQMVIDAEDRAAVEATARVQAETKLAEVTPAAQAWQHFASAGVDMSVEDVAKSLSRDYSIVIGRQRLFRLLADWEWIFRRGGVWVAYQAQIDTGRLASKLQQHHHPRTGELVPDPPQVRITHKGAQEILRRLTAAKSVEVSA